MGAGLFLFLTLLWMKSQVVWLYGLDAGGLRDSAHLRFKRSEGSVLLGWCIKNVADYQCELISGAMCEDVSDGSVWPFSAACKCATFGSTVYEQYTTNFLTPRCRMKMLPGKQLGDALCQIDEDCQHLYSTAVCNRGLYFSAYTTVGGCGCPSDFLPDPTSPLRCKAFECTSSSDCSSSFSPNSDCDRSPDDKPKCKCKPGYYLGVAGGGINNGRPQCTDFKNAYMCAWDGACPPPLICDGAQKCSCPTPGRVVSLKPGTNGVADCTVHAPVIGAPCSVVGADTECPPNAVCRSVGPNKVCLCKPYFRSIKGTDGKSTCQTILGDCCRTAADCWTKLPALSGQAFQLQCLKMPANAARGVCVCETGKSWDWNSFSTDGNITVNTPACAF